MKPAKLSLFFLILAIFSMVAGARGQNQGSGDLSNAYDSAGAGAKIFQTVMAAPDISIPPNIIEQAEAIAIFPGRVRFGNLMGGSSGIGLVSLRDPQTRQFGAPFF